MNPTQTTMRLMQERNIYTCQVAGCENPAEESHHCLYSKRKGVKGLNEDYNLQIVCRACHKHTGDALTYENRIAFWNWTCEHYGYENVTAWYESLPLKVKERGYR